MRFLVFLLTFLPLLSSAQGWEKIEGCTLVADAFRDGDSFRVRTPEGREFIARLYFVDCPETNLEFPDRAADQAEALGVSVERVLEIGKEATDFTARQLSEPFTIWTRWRKAGGRTTRYAVMIQTSQGKWLCEELVKARLARVYGIRVPPPPETGAEDSRAWRERLQSTRPL